MATWPRWIVLAIVAACDSRSARSTGTAARDDARQDSCRWHPLVAAPDAHAAVPPPATLTVTLAACEQGSPAACMDLGLAYTEGTHGLTVDPVKAARRYAQACCADYMPACANLAFAVYDGLGVAADKEKARLLYIEACAAADATAACVNVGLMYEHGDGVPVALRSAAAYYRRGCDHGDPRACTALGALLEDGRGVDRADPAEAARLYRAACAQDQWPACNNLGVLLEKGVGVAVDNGEVRRPTSAHATAREARPARTSAAASPSGAVVRRMTPPRSAPSHAAAIPATRPVAPGSARGTTAARVRGATPTARARGGGRPATTARRGRVTTSPASPDVDVRGRRVDATSPTRWPIARWPAAARTLRGMVAQQRGDLATAAGELYPRARRPRCGATSPSAARPARDRNTAAPR